MFIVEKAAFCHAWHDTVRAKAPATWWLLSTVRVNECNGRESHRYNAAANASVSP